VFDSAFEFLFYFLHFFFILFWHSLMQMHECTTLFPAATRATLEPGAALASLQIAAIRSHLDLTMRLGDSFEFARYCDFPTFVALSVDTGNGPWIEMDEPWSAIGEFYESH
jgi:hypothetical protein